MVTDAIQKLKNINQKVDVLVPFLVLILIMSLLIDVYGSRGNVSEGNIYGGIIIAINIAKILMLIAVVIWAGGNSRYFTYGRFAGEFTELRKTLLYKQTLNKLGFLIPIAIFALNANGIINIIRLFKKNITVFDNIIIVQLIIIIFILSYTLIDHLSRNGDENYSDELAQKIRDNGARNAFYLSIFGVGAFQVTLALWGDLKQGIATTYGVGAIDISTIISVFILLAAWAVGNLYAHAQYR